MTWNSTPTLKSWTCTSCRKTYVEYDPMAVANTRHPGRYGRKHDGNVCDACLPKRPPFEGGDRVVFTHPLWIGNFRSNNLVQAGEYASVYPQRDYLKIVLDIPRESVYDEVWNSAFLTIENPPPYLKGAT